MTGKNAPKLSPEVSPEVSPKVSTPRALTPATLFAYADTFARAAEAADQGTVYPTLRQAARRFRTTQDAIEETIGDYHGTGYLGLIVGFKNGMGFATYGVRGDCQVEAYKDDK